MPVLDWSQRAAVESAPGKVSGAWVLRNIRMPVSAILDNLEVGAGVDDLMVWFDGLDRQQVVEFIAFAEAAHPDYLVSPHPLTLR